MKDSFIIYSYVKMDLTFFFELKPELMRNSILQWINVMYTNIYYESKIDVEESIDCKNKWPEKSYKKEFFFT